MLPDGSIASVHLAREPPERPKTLNQASRSGAER
jgi:hypothetical protein